MANFLRFALILLVALVSCSPAPSATPPIVDVPTVHVSPFALPFARSLGERYVATNGALPFDLVPANAPSALDAVEQGEAELHLDFPPVPADWFATPLGWEGISLIVHAEVPIRSLTLEELAGIYSGRIDNWQEFGRGLGPIQPVIPPQGDSLRTVFVSRVMPDDRITTLARLAPTPEEALRIARETEGAIALVPAHLSLPESGISVLRIEGELPEVENIAHGDYPLRVRIVAMAAEEPTGEIRDWLTWAQAKSE